MTINEQSATDGDRAPDPIVYVVDDEGEVRRSLGFFLKTVGFLPRPYLSGEDFLSDAADLAPGCVLLDVRLGGISGLDVIEALGPGRCRLPVIVMTGHGDVAMAVKSMKLGAIDFLEKPFEEEALVAALKRGFELLAHRAHAEEERRDAERLMAALSPRERNVLSLLSEGKSNKEVALELDLSVRTVEMHRAAMFDRLSVRSLPEALRIAFRAGIDLGNGSPALAE
ncbi:MAG: response regulator transcription factor [Proteobacteria bacterium]|nr:response regulator transcription factor [Pseudomonadota bacterium]